MKRLTLSLLFLVLSLSTVANAQNWPLMATPALSQGMLIVRGENTIYALGDRKAAKN